MDFSRDFYWHDAVIKSVIIDRNDPGVVDEIWVDVVCPTENEKGIIQRVVFESVFWVNLDLNFGHFGDNVCNVDMLDSNDKDLVDFYSKWKGYRDNIKLNAYVINLTSGGKIKIIAKDLKGSALVKKLEEVLK